ncbi:PTS sugar transporter subunit IIA [Trinickia acidisoli]|uniref:PTS sugar transporter subunit IIA n=1 Tax=Trinickia acidisoli TaxID=2767482 RepID=UPI001A8E7B36|nr:PTS mannose transporter subunit IIA [Trinickia acidisoli]
MAGILIIAHAPLASALKECVAHIYGGLPARIGAIDVLPDSDPTQVVALAHSEIERLREENGMLVLTDIFGATPANIASRLATLPGVRVLAGVNLPMLVRGVCYRTCELDALVDKALAGATKGMHLIGPLVAPDQAGKPVAEAECAPPGVPILAPCSGVTAGEAVVPPASAANPIGPAR